MNELFNFKIIKRQENLLDTEVSRFIETCLDPYELYWGGGYNNNTIQGNVVGEINPIMLTDIIHHIVLFFDDADFHFEIFENWKKYFKVDFFNNPNVIMKF